MYLHSEKKHVLFIFATLSLYHKQTKKPKPVFSFPSLNSTSLKL